MREISNGDQESCARGIAAAIRGPPVLLVLCGPSHAGKSTFSERLRKDFVTVSSDEVREKLGVGFNSCRYEPAVWDAFEAAKNKALREGRNIILDACHMSAGSRCHAVQGADGRHRKICVVFDPPLETIRARCLRAKRMPLGEVERMYGAWQDSKPTSEELKRLGFDDVVFVRDEQVRPAREVSMSLCLDALTNRLCGEFKERLYAVPDEHGKVL